MFCDSRHHEGGGGEAGQQEKSETAPHGEFLSFNMTLPVRGSGPNCALSLMEQIVIRADTSM